MENEEKIIKSKIYSFCNSTIPVIKNTFKESK